MPALGRKDKYQIERDEMVARLRARRAEGRARLEERVAAGDTYAALRLEMEKRAEAQQRAADQRAAAEQAERDHIERERLIKLLGLPKAPRKRKASPAQIVKGLRTAGERGQVRVELGDGTVVTRHARARRAR